MCVTMRAHYWLFVNQISRNIKITTSFCLIDPCVFIEQGKTLNFQCYRRDLVRHLCTGEAPILKAPKYFPSFYQCRLFWQWYWYILFSFYRTNPSNFHACYGSQRLQSPFRSHLFPWISCFHHSAQDLMWMWTVLLFFFTLSSHSAPSQLKLSLLILTQLLLLATSFISLGSSLE